MSPHRRVHPTVSDSVYGWDPSECAHIDEAVFRSTCARIFWQHDEPRADMFTLEMTMACDFL